MKKRMTIGLLGVYILLMTGCSSTKSTNVNMLATTDLHGHLPYELTSYVKDEKSKDKNITLVDAGDFFDFGTSGSAMNKYFDDKWSNEEYETKYLEVPFAKEMKEVGYDTVVLGNHEFIGNNKTQLDNMVSDFKKQDIDVLSANTYKENGENYVKPYVIKDISTPEGNVKLGILGLTIQEVGQKYNDLEKGDFKPTSEGLRDFEGYDGKLYMGDLVEDAKKWVNVMKNDKPDIIVAVVHSGENSKETKYPGNRIQELAKEVDGIDAIVAGHTHKAFAQHDYKNKSGEKVIVTQPGKDGECISKINFKLEKNNNKWNVIDKSSEIVKFEKSKEDKNFENFIDEVIIPEKLDKIPKEINLSDVTPFDWDKAYVFEPYTSPEKIYDTIGYKWRDIKKTESEDMIQMIFMRDNKVVCHLYGYEKYLSMDFQFDKSEYKDNVITIYPKDNDKFKVDIDEKWLITHLKHI